MSSHKVQNLIKRYNAIINKYKGQQAGLEMAIAANSNDEKRKSEAVIAFTLLTDSEKTKAFETLAYWANKSFEEVNQALEEVNQKHAAQDEKLKKITESHKNIKSQRHREEFKNWVSTHNIVIERVTDLWDFKAINTDWLHYQKATLRKWYKEAMPDVVLKRGNTRLNDRI